MKFYSNSFRYDTAIVQCLEIYFFTKHSVDINIKTFISKQQSAINSIDIEYSVSDTKMPVDASF